MRILGFDPGLNQTGWGAIDVEGNHFTHVESGVLNPPAGELAERLGFIVRGLSEIIARLKPELICVEKVFVNINPQSTLFLSQARAAALIAANLAGVKVLEYTPSEIKLAVTGSGKADKLMIQKMVAMLLQRNDKLPPDEADALGAAICGANRHTMQNYENQGTTTRTYATARHGRTQRGARQAWTSAFKAKGSTK